MAELEKYMVVHKNPGIDCKVLQANWRELARVKLAKWVRTYFNEDEGLRYCIWLAPSVDALEKIFSEINVSWETITPVEETIPDLWGERWDVHLAADATADTLGN